ncbi:MAG TPA: SRPBCC family protein [Burkholderiales bacterium]
MKRFAMLSALLLASSLALAHGPTRQKVTETVTIKASPDAVWAKVRDFGGLQNWHPAVASSSVTDGSKEGSVRVLTLKDGGKVEETLESMDDGAKKFSYRAKDGGALPVTNYSSTLTVKAGDGGTTVVEWRGAFYRAYTNNDPPPDKNDEAAVKAITGVYTSGLANLKKLMEQ